jgi:hypothetical protein
VRLDEFFAADSVATLNPRASAITASFGVNDGRGVAQRRTGCRTRAHQGGREGRRRSPPRAAPGLVSPLPAIGRAPRRRGGTNPPSRWPRSRGSTPRRRGPACRCSARTHRWRRGVGGEHLTRLAERASLCRVDVDTGVNYCGQTWHGHQTVGARRYRAMPTGWSWCDRAGA